MTANNHIINNKTHREAYKSFLDKLSWINNHAKRAPGEAYYDANKPYHHLH